MQPSMTAKNAALNRPRPGWASNLRSSFMVEVWPRLDLGGNGSD